MSDSKVRILSYGLVVGLAVASAAFWAGRSTRPAADEGAPQPAAAASPNAAAAAAADAAECYLGVIVPRRAVDVAARGAGQIENVLVDVGDAAEKGELLARLETRMTRHALEKERAAVRAAEAETELRRLRMERSEAEKQRRSSLTDVLSQEELARADASLDEAAAEFAAAQARLGQARARVAELVGEMELAEIRAPFSGRVTSRYLDPGAVAAAGTPVLRLISAEQGRGGRLVRFAVPPEEAADLRLGEELRIEIGTPPNRLRGELSSLAPEVDAPSQTIFAEASIEAAPEARNFTSGAAVRVSRASSQGACGSDPSSSRR